MILKLDSKGSKSICCVTKIDQVKNPAEVLEILKNKKIALKNGYIGLKYSKDTLTNSLKKEKEFFLSHPIYSTLSCSHYSTE